MANRKLKPKRLPWWRRLLRWLFVDRPNYADHGSGTGGNGGGGGGGGGDGGG